MDNRPLLKVSILVGGIMVAFWVASYFPDLALTLIISALAAFILRPVVRVFEFRVGMRRSVSIALVFLLIGGILVESALTLVPFLIETAKSMKTQFQGFPFDEKLNEAAKEIEKMNIPFVDAEFISQKVKGILEGGKQSLNTVGEAAASFLMNLLIVPFITYFILAEGDFGLKGIIQKVPNKYFEMTLNVINKIEKELIGYLRGWILDSVIVGILSVIGYYFIHVDYAILLGILMGVANLIPYVGPIFGIVPAYLLSITQHGDFSLILPITLLTAGVQLVDNTVIQPLCFSKTVDMHPVTVIFVLIIGNTLMGISGMLLAIPVATILKASAVETYWGLSNYHITA